MKNEIDTLAQHPLNGQGVARRRDAAGIGTGRYDGATIGIAQCGREAVRGYAPLSDDKRRAIDARGKVLAQSDAWNRVYGEPVA